MTLLTDNEVKPFIQDSPIFAPLWGRARPQSVWQKTNCGLHMSYQTGQNPPFIQLRAVYLKPISLKQGFEVVSVRGQTYNRLLLKAFMSLGTKNLGGLGN